MDTKLDDSENSVLAAQITAALNRDGRERQEIALAVGVTKQAVTGWEKTGRIKKSTLKKLLDVLEIESFDETKKAPCASAQTTERVEAAEILKLLSLYWEATPKGRRRIIESAEEVPKTTILRRPDAANE